MLTWLHENDPFPDVESALDDPNGLLCAGLDLSPARVLAAYQRGIFPWYSEGQPVLWWSPNPRMVMRPSDFRLHRSLRKTIKHATYEITVDKDFPAVMAGCAEPRLEQEGTWISDDIIAVYTELHKLGVAHSVECRIEGELVGGLYGLAIGRVFFGESMFARRTDASKIAFSHLVTQLRRWQFELIDCQQDTPHLASLGAAPISRKHFTAELSRLIHSNATVDQYGKWLFDADLRDELVRVPVPKPKFASIAGIVP
jgi:leucyl/phenylalanyl-tRNA---protein transferase